MSGWAGPACPEPPGPTVTADPREDRSRTRAPFSSNIRRTRRGTARRAVSTSRSSSPSAAIRQAQIRIFKSTGFKRSRQCRGRLRPELALCAGQDDGRRHAVGLDHAACRIQAAQGKGAAAEVRLPARPRSLYKRRRADHIGARTEDIVMRAETERTHRRNQAGHRPAEEASLTGMPRCAVSTS